MAKYSDWVIDFPRLDLSSLNSNNDLTKTRSQSVARIADRTASQHLWGSRDVIGHVTIWYPMSFPIGGPLEPSLYL